MSLKNLYSITPKEKAKLEGKTVCIQEKMDMPHVWIRINEDGVIFLRERQPITEVDRILDDTYSKIQNELIDDNFTEEVINNILNFCGPCDLKIFYLPNKQPYHIEYEYLYEHDKRYFLSDLWFLGKRECKDKKFEYLNRIVDLVNCPKFIHLNISIFTWDKKCNDLLSEYIIQGKEGFDFISNFSFDYNIISHKKFFESLGYIIKTEQQSWQILNFDYPHETIDKTHSDIRKTILSDFIEKVLSDEEFMNTLPLFIDGRKEKKYSYERIYLDVIQKMFLRYIETSSLIIDNGYKDEDLRPQIPRCFTYINSLDMNYVTNDMVKVTCLYNRTMQELLRLLIHSFYRINAYTFYHFNEFETKKISKFLILFS